MPTASNSTSRIIHAETLTAARFVPFGIVLEAGGETGRLVNQGRARRIEGARYLSHERATKPVLDLYQIAQSQLPFAVTCFERHPLSCQIFTPMVCARYLVVVTLPDETGRPDVSRAVAFLGHGAQAVCYGKGTWHAPMIALDEPALMTMLMWESGEAADCEEFSLGDELRLSIGATGS